MMECKAGHNVGHIERMIRISLGIGLLAVGGLTAVPTWGTAIALIMGMIALVTGLIGFCPAWGLLGMNTGDRTHV